DAEPGGRPVGLGTVLPGLLVPVVHQLHRLQPDRRDATVAVGQNADDAAVLGVSRDRGPGGRPGRQHPEVAGWAGGVAAGPDPSASANDTSSLLMMPCGMMSGMEMDGQSYPGTGWKRP